MIKTVWTFLGSIRFVIPLLIVLTLVSVLGIVIPQGQSPDFYASRMGQVRSAIILRTELDHVFSAMWFYGLLGLLSLSVIVCSVTRLWQNLGRAMRTPFLAGPEAISRLRFTRTLQGGAEPAAAAKAIASLLRSRLYHCAQRNEDGGAVQVSGHSGVFKDAGSFLFHLGLVTLFAGGLVGRLGGYSYTESLSAGHNAPVRDRQFQVRCDWFRLEPGNGGEIKDYKSSLSIIDATSGRVLRHKVIEVNAPLGYQGVRFYQSSYGMESTRFSDCRLNIKGPGLEGEGFSGRFTQDSAVAIPSAGLSVRVSAFVSDFVIDMQTKEVSSRESKGENPAVKVAITRGGDTLQNRWVFANYPDMHASDAPYHVSMEQWSPAYFSGIQVVKNPGVPVIWIGIIVMTMAIFLLFYVPRKNIWVIATPAGGGSCTITIGGSTNVAAEGFQSEFDRLCASVGRLVKRPV